MSLDVFIKHQLRAFFRIFRGFLDILSGEDDKMVLFFIVCISLI